MKTLLSAIFAVLLLTPAWGQDVAASPAPQIEKIHAMKIILVGDSTMQVHSGWGGAFCAYHVTSALACVNLGRGGRSTKTYRAEGSWDIALGEMKTPGFEKIYVLIQFGHNDQPGKPGRSTDLATEYPANLAAYVREARAAGAIPVLATPLSRRMFQDGVLTDNLRPWAEATIKVAQEMNVPLIDFHAESMKAVALMGPAASARLAQTPPPPEYLKVLETGNSLHPNTTNPDKPFLPRIDMPAPPVEGMAAPKLSFDYTHLGLWGADVFSRMMARLLASSLPDLRPNLIP